ARGTTNPPTAPSRTRGLYDTPVPQPSLGGPPAVAPPGRGGARLRGPPSVRGTRTARAVSGPGRVEARTPGRCRWSGEHSAGPPPRPFPRLGTPSAWIRRRARPPTARGTVRAPAARVRPTPRLGGATPR